ncbi:MULTISPECIES: type VI secretion system tube protein TssD [unclassified Pseudomonas]|uniref:type VI secretion system tube protein TssD n=1 Tax=unclassified Pseudomonas TaxID=196821 RepID=UPI002AC963A3|nr:MULTISPECIES: type VI secretion system tube protein TssD [unclassified Pseudomonas]MEB0040512.1 type VI secretion system tube protein TssD [Pseudomonas sp. MH10]MEB0077617.1 type VI secretion system tube protein TssD [Pseudomonas sp. MH10out]MEB0089639.1 type VI secretion system tube protein TssD [Pseudomonas sp. CCI4.2]MEB0101818.1 type VI secretion system tube protein TssD [Pseudomonas sp. CCI3.2]MEB0121236.1 type VI secretion system tube protein TssD [Pseudomonas sp. CCI1.2]
MSIKISMSINGRDQGLISKNCTSKESQGDNSLLEYLDEITVITLKHEMTGSENPEDDSYPPLVITKYLDLSSPMLMNALVNEEMIDCEISVYKELPSGSSEKLYSIALTGGAIIDIHTRHRKPPKNESGTQEKLSILYHTATYTHYGRTAGSFSFVNSTYSKGFQ